MYVTGPGPSEAHVLDVSLLIPRFEVLRQVRQNFDLDLNDPGLESNQITFIVTSPQHKNPVDQVIHLTFASFVLFKR